MYIDKWIDGHVDSLIIRLDFVDKSYRDDVYNNILDFVIDKKLVGIKPDKKKSNKHFQVTKLISAYTSVATITRSAFTHSFLCEFTISIAFHGLRRYNDKIDYKSKSLLQYILAFLNTKTLPFIITQLDICTDIPCHIENLLAICVNRKSRKKYHELGQYDEHGNKIQTYDSTYEIEKFESDKKRSNVMKVSYLYDKRKKEIKKANNDIGYDLSRYEMKLQRRFFLKNEVSVNSFLKELKDYKIFYFEKIEDKQNFISQYNTSNNNKHRNKIISNYVDSTVEIKTNMLHIADFIRMVDTIKFDTRGVLTIAKNEDYLIGKSRFNKYKNLL